MSKKVSISKKIAAGLMVGLMLGSCVPVQATFWGNIKSFGSNIVTKVSAIKSDVNQWYRSKFPRDHPINLGLAAVCLVAGGCSISCGLDILKNGYGLSSLKKLFFVESLGLFGFGAMTSGYTIFKRRRIYIRGQRFMREYSYRFCKEIKPTVPESYELADIDDEINSDDNDCV